MTRAALALLASLLFLIAYAFPATRTAWTVRYDPPQIVNGSPILFRVIAPAAASALSGTWLGHELTFTFDQPTKTWIALAGASLETTPGSYLLALHAETSGHQTSFEKKIPIERRRYPRVQLKVPERYTAPNPEDQREIAADKKIKDDAFKTRTADREWQGSFAVPVDAPISELFGVQRLFNGSVKATHQGLDFRAHAGTTVSAVNRGTIVLARPLFFEGNCIVIDHGQGLLTLYLHLSKFLVKEGDEVKKGEPIALSGGTGRATGPHLHLAVRWQGEYLNPQTLLALRLPQ
jgi:murein DD-endopeptidase MepM/ murein hydrolase activator NlpD